MSKLDPIQYLSSCSFSLGLSLGLPGPCAIEASDEILPFLIDDRPIKVNDLESLFPISKFHCSVVRLFLIAIQVDLVS